MLDPDCARLLAGLAAGRDEAFAELIRRYGPALARTARTLVGDEAEAEDLVQELFVGMVRSRKRLAGVESLTAYLFTALRRAAARHCERRAREEAARAARSRELDKTPRAIRSSGSARDEELRRAVAELPLAEREVLALKLDAGLTYRDIGSLLEISPNTAASRFRLALERLRRELGSTRA